MQHGLLRMCYNLPCTALAVVAVQKNNTNRKETAMEYYTIIGVDTGDKSSSICILEKQKTGQRRILLETSCATTAEGFTETFRKFDRAWPVVFETGTHCRWMDRLFRGLGFKTFVANAGKLPTISRSNTKNDRNDAAELAKLGLADPEMLHPVSLRDEESQQMLRLHKARQLLIKQRTQTMNEIRGFGKSIGFRIDRCSAEKFHDLDKSGWPAMLEEASWPLIDVLEVISRKIAAYEKAIEDLAKAERFGAMVERCKEVYGVGPICATVFVAAIGCDTDKFEHARDVGPYLGLVPRQDQSGDTDRQLHMTKAGSKLVRNVLVECANVVTKETARDTDIKLKGLRIARSGGNIAKKKAKGAVARSLAVTMMALLKHPEREYVPLSPQGEEGFRRYRAEMEYLAHLNDKKMRKDAQKSGTGQNGKKDKAA